MWIVDGFIMFRLNAMSDRLEHELLFKDVRRVHIIQKRLELIHGCTVQVLILYSTVKESRIRSGGLLLTHVRGTMYSAIRTFSLLSSLGGSTGTIRAICR